jgi:hypothetical protein
VSAKRLAVLVVVAIVVVVVYQAAAFYLYYGNVRSSLDDMIPNYVAWGEEKFREELLRELREQWNLPLERNAVRIEVDEVKKTVHVEFEYRRPLRLLFVNLDREMRVARTYKDADL